MTETEQLFAELIKARDQLEQTKAHAQRLVDADTAKRDAIVRALAKRAEGQRLIARHAGVSQPIISRIVKRQD
jgi:DNA-binding MarR family transcriptional regulator